MSVNKRDYGSIDTWPNDRLAQVGYAQPIPAEAPRKQPSRKEAKKARQAQGKALKVDKVMPVRLTMDSSDRNPKRTGMHVARGQDGEGLTIHISVDKAPKDKGKSVAQGPRQGNVERILEIVELPSPNDIGGAIQDAFKVGISQLVTEDSVPIRDVPKVLVDMFVIITQQVL